MHTVLKKALLLAALLAATRIVQAAAPLSQTDFPLPHGAPWHQFAPLNTQADARVDDTAQAAVAASQALPGPTVISAVPEPPVYMMLLVGVGLLGLAARRQAIPPIFTADQD